MSDLSDLILALVRAHPGLTAGDIAVRVATPLRSATVYLGRHRAAGSLRRDDAGRWWVSGAAEAREALRAARVPCPPVAREALEAAREPEVIVEPPPSIADGPAVPCRCIPEPVEDVDPALAARYDEARERLAARATVPEPVTVPEPPPSSPTSGVVGTDPMPVGAFVVIEGDGDFAPGVAYEVEAPLRNGAQRLIVACLDDGEPRWGFRGDHLWPIDRGHGVTSFSVAIGARWTLAEPEVTPESLTERDLDTLDAAGGQNLTVRQLVEALCEVTPTSCPHTEDLLRACREWLRRVDGADAIVAAAAIPVAVAR